MHAVKIHLAQLDPEDTPSGAWICRSTSDILSEASSGQQPGQQLGQQPRQQLGQQANLGQFSKPGPIAMLRLENDRLAAEWDKKHGPGSCSRGLQSSCMPGRPLQDIPATSAGRSQQLKPGSTSRAQSPSSTTVTDAAPGRACASVRSQPASTGRQASVTRSRSPDASKGKQRSSTATKSHKSSDCTDKAVQLRSSLPRSSANMRSVADLHRQKSPPAAETSTPAGSEQQIDEGFAQLSSPDSHGAAASDGLPSKAANDTDAHAGPSNSTHSEAPQVATKQSATDAQVSCERLPQPRVHPNPAPNPPSGTSQATGSAQREIIQSEARPSAASKQQNRPGQCSRAASAGTLPGADPAANPVTDVDPMASTGDGDNVPTAALAPLPLPISRQANTDTVPRIERVSSPPHHAAQVVSPAPTGTPALSPTAFPFKLVPNRTSPVPPASLEGSPVLSAGLEGPAAAGIRKEANKAAMEGAVAGSSKADRSADEVPEGIPNAAKQLLAVVKLHIAAAGLPVTEVPDMPAALEQPQLQLDHQAAEAGKLAEAVAAAALPQDDIWAVEPIKEPNAAALPAGKAAPAIMPPQQSMAVQLHPLGSGRGHRAESASAVLKQIRDVVLLIPTLDIVEGGKHLQRAAALLQPGDCADLALVDVVSDVDTPEASALAMPAAEAVTGSMGNPSGDDAAAQVNAQAKFSASLSFCL